MPRGRTTTAILLLASTTTTLCASYALHGPNNIPARNRRLTTRCSPRMDVPAAVSLGAGMLGGAIGVGVAYPLDTLKTKLQARESGGSNQGSLAVAVDIVREEGMSGFYGGVSSTMAGQALIKGVVFFVYEWAKALLGSGNIALILAACISGAVGSLVVTPVERVIEPVKTSISPVSIAKTLIRTTPLALGLIAKSATPTSCPAAISIFE